MLEDSNIIWAVFGVAPPIVIQGVCDNHILLICVSELHGLRSEGQEGRVDLQCQLHTVVWVIPTSCRHMG